MKREITGPKKGVSIGWKGRRRKRKGEKRRWGEGGGAEKEFLFLERPSSREQGWGLGFGGQTKKRSATGQVTKESNRCGKRSLVARGHA